MHIISPDTKIDFLSKKKITLPISLAIILAGFISIMVHGGLNLGIDFAGGTLVQAKFEKAVPSDDIRILLNNSELGSVDVQEFGQPEEVLIKITSSSDKFTDVGKSVKAILEAKYTDNPISIERVEMVGPKVGNELRSQAILAMLYAIIGIIIYISWRFEFRFATASIIALVHDVLVIISIFSLLNLEFTLQIIAALLTIIGYSLNDTIVVFDRIRENLLTRRKDSLVDTINLSVNKTLSRTLLTSLTTLLVVIILFIFGGSVIHDFAFALTLGVIVGTYSSIFIASPVLVFWQKYSKTSLTPSKKDVSLT